MPHLTRQTFARYQSRDKTVRAHLEPYYSEIGRPSIDPELMIRMLIVGYCFGVHAERRLMREVHLNLTYRWLARRRGSGPFDLLEESSRPLSRERPSA